MIAYQIRYTHLYILNQIICPFKLDRGLLNK